MGYWTVILSANQNSVFPNLFYFMNQIRNCVFFLVFYGASRTPSEVGIFKNCMRAFSIRIYFHFSLSLRALSLQKEPTGENSAIFEQFFSPPLRPLWKKERAFPLPIVPRAIIAFFYWNTQQELLPRREEQLFIFSKIVTLHSV